MVVLILLAVSVALQLVATFLALRLAYLTAWRAAWLLIATAILLMAVRRSATLVQLVAQAANGHLPATGHLVVEIVALVISILMVAGLAWFAPLFLRGQRSEQALRESQHTLSILLNTLPGMVYRCRNDEYWTMEYVSEGCEVLTGYAASDLLNNRTVAYSELVHADDQQWLMEKCQQSLAARMPCANEYRIITAEGQERWVWDQARGMYSASGELVSIEGLITDITSRKKVEVALKMSEARFRTLVEHAPEAVVMLNVQTYSKPSKPNELPSLMADVNSIGDWTIGEAQMEWLEKTLQHATERFRFVCMHHPAGGNAGDPSNTLYGRGGARAWNTGEQLRIHNLMKAHKVQIFFYGHDHVFVDDIVDGIHYALPGSCGAPWKFTKAETGYERFWADSGHARLNVTPEKATVTFINLDGKELHSFSVLPF